MVLDGAEFDELTSAMNELSEPFEKFVETKQSGQMFSFWKTYMIAVEAMMALIKSERSGNWELYLDSLVATIPVFFAYDRQNYSKCL